MNSAPGIRQSNAPPLDSDFTPLQEHQEQTPDTFFGAKPVLYSYHAGLALSVSREKLQSLPLASPFHTEQDGADEGDVLVRDVELWVNSNDVTLFQTAPSPLGLSIPYPKIALHAVGSRSSVPALLLNLTLNDPEHVNDAEDIDVLDITILPPNFDKENPETACIRDMYDALNRGAELHPDPYDDEDGGEEDLSAPGATGWITAENMGEFMDEEGNFRGTMIGGEELGPGAGTVRQRDTDGHDERTDGTNGVNGHDGKWQRTD